MKKLHLIIMLAAVVLLAGCTKQETPTTEQNSVVGTKWTTSYADDIMVLEFASATEVIAYFTYSNGALIGDVFNGTYQQNGNAITFNNFRIRWLFSSSCYYELRSGTIVGSILQTKGRETFDITNGNWSSWSENWNKQ